MPMHPYDGLNKLRDLLNEELRKSREPGIFKTRYEVDNSIIVHALYYLSLSDHEPSPEFMEDLIMRALFSFEKTDPDGYYNFTSVDVMGEIIYPLM